MSELSFWTAADAAELDILVHEAVRLAEEHRARCEACKPGDCPEYVAWRQHLEVCAACRGDAPITYGPPCSSHAQFVAHGDSCPCCNPCPTLTRLVEIVIDWRDGRVLRSKAEWLRRLENVREAV